MIRVSVLGAEGRMGQAICRLLRDDPRFKLVAGIDRATSLKNVINETDVVIDFSTREATLQNIPIIVEARKSVVVGTTGFSQSERDDFLKMARRIPCVFAPNMSVGVNVLFNLAEEVTKTLKNYDIEIVEAHHGKKKDAPSGTALKIKEKIEKSLTEEKLEKNIPVHSVRAGDIVGEHTIIYATEGERIELTHRASSRDTFAKGAIEAAAWVVNKKPGVYDMGDVLSL